MDLKSLQTSLFNDVMKQSASENTLSKITGNGVATEQQRLQVYIYAYYIRIKEAIEMDFPIAIKLLGEEKHEALFEKFVTEVGSTNYSLNVTGKSWMAFLKSQKEILVSPLILEMMDFEWEIIESRFSSYKADAMVKSFILNHMLIKISPSLRFRRSQYPLVEIQIEEKLPEPMTLEPNFILTYFHEEMTHYCNVDENLFLTIEFIAANPNMDAVGEFIGTLGLNEEEQQVLISEVFEFCFARNILYV